MPSFFAENPAVRFAITPLTNPPEPIPMEFVERMLLTVVQERFVMTEGAPNDAFAPLRGTTVLEAAAMQDAGTAFAALAGAAFQAADQNNPPSAWSLGLLPSAAWRWITNGPHTFIGQLLPSPGAGVWTVEWPTVSPLFRGAVWIEYSVKEVTVL